MNTTSTESVSHRPSHHLGGGGAPSTDTDLEHGGVTGASRGGATNATFLCTGTFIDYLSCSIYGKPKAPIRGLLDRSHEAIRNKETLILPGPAGTDIPYRVGVGRSWSMKLEASPQLLISAGVTPSSHKPAAMVDIKGSLAAAMGPTRLREYVNSLSDILFEVEEVKVSRLDLSCDTQGYPFSPDDVNSFTSKADNRGIFWVGRDENARFNSIILNRSGATSAIIYQKYPVDIPSEMSTIHRCTGMDVESPVWRLEFRLSRKVLNGRDVNLENLEERMPQLWKFLTSRWVRHIIPGRTRRHRCPSSPFWEIIQQASPAPKIPLPRIERRPVSQMAIHLRRVQESPRILQEMGVSKHEIRRRLELGLRHGPVLDIG